MTIISAIEGEVLHMPRTRPGPRDWKFKIKIIIN